MSELHFEETSQLASRNKGLTLWGKTSLCFFLRIHTWMLSAHAQYIQTSDSKYKWKLLRPELLWRARFPFSRYSFRLWIRQNFPLSNQHMTMHPKWWSNQQSWRIRIQSMLCLERGSNVEPNWTESKPFFVCSLRRISVLSQFDLYLSNTSTNITSSHIKSNIF